jgi:hypothetical protein
LENFHEIGGNAFSFCDNRLLCCTCGISRHEVKEKQPARHGSTGTETATM